MFMRFLLETALGNVLCVAIEHITGCMLVPLPRLDYDVAATEKGRAAVERWRAAEGEDRAHEIRRRGRQIR